MASVCDSRNWNFRSNSFVRAPSSGGGSNAPRPAVSVPHVDVNADGCRARQARSCKSIACRAGIPEFLVVSSSLQRLDDLQNWHHSQTVVSCYCNVLNFAVAYSRAFVLLKRLFCLTSAGFDRLFVLLTSAGLERMKHVKVFEGRLQRPSPFLIRWASRCERGWMLSETREKLQNYCILRG